MATMDDHLPTCETEMTDGAEQTEETTQDQRHIWPWWVRPLPKEKEISPKKILDEESRRGWKNAMMRRQAAMRGY